MLNLIWLALLLCGVAVAGLNGKLDLLSHTTLTSARAAVMEVALPLVGAMALWLGMMRLAERAGLIQLLAKWIRPLMRRLFPEIPSDHPAMGAMMMNIAANMLGVSNAATPFGLKAMDQLNRLNTKPGVATNAMCTFLALNTSMIQLVPATAINVLSINGSQHPASIVGSTLISTSFATLAAVLIVKFLQRLPWFSWERQPSGSALAAPSQENGQPAEEAPRSMAAWGPWALSALGLFFLGLLAVQAFPALHGLPWISALPSPGLPGPANFFDGIANIFRALSPLAIPFLITFFPLYAAAKGLPVYTEFVEGAKEGFQVALRIIPYLVGMLVAIAVFRDSGCLDLLKSGVSPILNALQVPSELLPMILMRPLSGSGSIAVLNDLVKHFGADNILSYMAATIYGSAETTFYVVAVYFGAVNITRTRHAIPAGLLADLVGMLAAVFVCRLLFH